MSAWRDTRVPPGDGPNPWWSTPSPESTNWRPPGDERAFHGDPSWSQDRPGRSFEARKKHGWWGKTVYYDQNGREVG